MKARLWNKISAQVPRQHYAMDSTNISACLVTNNVHYSRILIIKPTRCTNFSNLFLEKTRHVSDSCSVHHQEFFTVHTVITACEQDQDGTSCQQTCMTYTIVVCTLKNSCWWTEEMCETCRFSSKNKFEKLVHLVGFIIRIDYDARSPERHTYSRT